VESVEGPVTEHHKHVPFLQLRTQLLDNPVGGGLVEGGLAGLDQVIHEASGIEAFLGLEIGRAVYLADDDAMGRGEGLGKLLLEDGAPCGVRAGLEESPEGGPRRSAW